MKRFEISERIEKVMRREKKMFANLDVITSYSIHYTKVYEFC